MTLPNQALNRQRLAARETLESRFSAEQQGMLMAALLMMLAGWGLLLQLALTTRPRIGGEIWLFFILLQIASTGTAIPVFQLLSLRWAPADDKTTVTALILRRSVWVGILVVTCAWLMIPRALSLPIFVIMALGFAAIEVFLRNRELAHER